MFEDLENFRVQLATADSRVTIDPAQGTVNIVDNDGERYSTHLIMSKPLRKQGSFYAQVYLF